jgi:hypothetical protein
MAYFSLFVTSLNSSYSEMPKWKPGCLAVCLPFRLAACCSPE